MENYIGYLDASVALRFILGEADQIEHLKKATALVSSEIIRVECLRTIDRMKKRLSLSDTVIAEKNEAVFKFLKEIDFVLLSSRVLQEASQSFPTVVGTVDAIHLASALLWQKSEGNSLVMMTHDVELGRAARSMGMQVLGVREETKQ